MKDSSNFIKSDAKTEDGDKIIFQLSDEDWNYVNQLHHKPNPTIRKVLEHIPIWNIKE